MSWGLHETLLSESDYQKSRGSANTTSGLRGRPKYRRGWGKKEPTKQTVCTGLEAGCQASVAHRGEIQVGPAPAAARKTHGVSVSGVDHSP